MTKLLSANFLRLRKSKVLWVCLCVCVFLGAAAALGEFRFQVSAGTDLSVPEVAQYKALLEGQFFEFSAFIGILAAALIPLFLGTEYSDGAIRNKITVGHSRVQLYLVNLLTAYLVTLLSTAATLLAVLGIGLPTIGWFTVPIPALVLNFLGSLVMEAAFCAMFTAVSMNCAKKAASAVACILLFFGLMVANVYIQGRLNAPEFVSGYALIDGELKATEPEPNPAYLRGGERAAYEFAYDLLPTGQASQYTMLEAARPARLAVCAAALTALSTGAGLILFRRKDLK